MASDIMTTPISEIIRNRIIADNGNYFCNDNISNYVSQSELDDLILEVEGKFQSLLESLVIDTLQDHNTKGTAHRVAKMYVNEIFSGRYNSIPNITTFPNVTDYDQVYVTGPIAIRSTCAHHFAAIRGKCYVGIFPGKNVLGLSKFNRMVDWIANRPSIQEEMTVQIADLIHSKTHAEGVAVLIRAEHGCMLDRGVKAHESKMTTTVLRGVFKTTPHLKQEFYDIISKM
jgi:GTP cyclohydrolase I